MRLLVIGCTGFIGSHVFEHFMKINSIECFGCDLPDKKIKNYTRILDFNKDIDALFQHNAFDYCINCSGAANVSQSFANPSFDFQLNCANVHILFDIIRKNNRKTKLINFSSAAVYGNPSKIPIAESDSLSPMSPYGHHKVFAEHVCREYFDLFGIESCSLRVFSAYGPRLKKQLLWDIYTKIISSNSLQLSGTGRETRDFIFINDIISILEALINFGFSGCEVFNVANGVEVSIEHIAALMTKELDYSGSISFSGIERKGDPKNWKADISKILKIGYKQKFSIESGIREYVKWLKEEKLL